MNLTALTRPYFRAVCRAEWRAAEQPEASQRMLLGGLVAAAAKTQMGRLHGFGAMATYSDFASEVPVVSYPDIRADVMRMVEGEPDVLWPGRCRRFAQSSGKIGRAHV